MTTFLRILNDKDKVSALQEVSFSVRSGGCDARVFELHPQTFTKVPGAPFAYWITQRTRSLFTRLGRFGSEGRTAQHGCSTKDDTRFVRLSWEITNAAGKWFPYAKGGSYSPFYQDIVYLINWANDAKELEASLLKKFPYLGGSANWVLHRESSYFFPGIKWPLRASAFAPQTMPRGVVFSGRSYAAFADESDLLWLLALTNSSVFDYLFKILLGRFGFPEFLVGTIALVPFPEISSEKRRQLDSLSRKSWSLRRQLYSTEETSHAFLLPTILRSRFGDFDPPSIEAELARIQVEINTIVFDLYGLSEADCAAVCQSMPSESCADNDSGVYDEEDAEAETPADHQAALLSWAVGVAFGRFDWRLATGEREMPPEPGPFDPLPPKSPGMLPDDAEPFHDHAGILVDDPGHLHDLAHLVEEVLERVDMPVPGDVRRWLQRNFFSFHLKRYSKSRRKASIYWPFSTASGSYTLWIYYPSLTSQTLYTAINDFLDGPNGKLRQVGDDVAALRAKGSGRSQEDEKQFENLQNFELELIELRDALLGIARNYHPNPDDGVQITAAPLWPLFRYKPWQKVLKETYVQLEKGDYDWAHLAMNYYPDRVRKKCRTDKSLAIAHNLEELYVEPPAKPKKGRSQKAKEA